jgi:hypothetical protein
MRGVNGHKLELLHVGRRVFTTEEAFVRWVARTNGQPVTTATPRQREAAIRRAERQLDDLGI